MLEEEVCHIEEDETLPGGGDLPAGGGGDLPAGGGDRRHRDG